LEISVPAVLVVFALSVALYSRVTPTTVTGVDTMRVNWAYWVAMMLAGILGTIGGDWAAKWVSELGAAIILFSIAAFAIWRFRLRGVLLQAAAYWASVGLIRSAGTAGGDSIAHTIGLAPSTVLTGIVFLALAVASSRRLATTAG
jgi:uncharacterized membrane-anchored protein